MTVSVQGKMSQKNRITSMIHT